MKDILSADIEGDKIMVDGQIPGQWMRTRRIAGTTVYATDNVTDTALCSLCTHPEDYATGRPGAVSGVWLRTANKGRIRVLRGSAWLCNTSDPASEVREIIRACKEYDLKFANTAAGTASALIRELNPAGEPLAERWRGISHGAIAAGPMLHMSGGSTMAQHVDLNAAYLHAMTKPLPSPLGSWYACEASDDWHIVTGYARVPDENDAASLPTYALGTGMVYPIGVVRGTWARQTWEVAAERGAELLPGCNFARHSLVIPFMRDTALWLWELRNKGAIERRLSKAVYTRLWGKMASAGHWKGRPDTGADSVTTTKYAGLYWQSTERVSTDKVYSPSYMPDVAAFITSHNHARMMRAINKLGDAVIASHIDAIWVDLNRSSRIPTSDALGAFSLEGEGEVRYFRQGCYISDWKRGAMGMPSDYQGNKSADDIRLWVDATSRASIRPSRVWDKDPQRFMDAQSWPAEIPVSLQRFGKGAEPGGSTWHNDVWSFGIEERAKRVAILDNCARGEHYNAD